MSGCDRRLDRHIAESPTRTGRPPFQGRGRGVDHHFLVADCRCYCRVFAHMPASPTMPTGTAPDRLTFCTLGPAATMVVS
jgi:hypothetical protein